MCIRDSFKRSAGTFCGLSAQRHPGGDQPVVSGSDDRVVMQGPDGNRHAVGAVYDFYYAAGGLLDDESNDSPHRAVSADYGVYRSDDASGRRVAADQRRKLDESDGHACLGSLRRAGV